MAKITYRDPDGSETVLDVPVGISVMQGAVAHGIDSIVALCGGAPACGTCHVYVDPDGEVPLPPMHAVEDEVLYDTACPRRENSRLTYQLTVTNELNGLVVDLPETQL